MAQLMPEHRCPAQQRPELAVLELAPVVRASLTAEGRRPPEKRLPQLVMLPSCSTAAKALLLAVIEATPAESWSATRLLLPPAAGLPQLTTEPSSFRAAKALSLETISTTPLLSCVLTALLSPPALSRPQVPDHCLQGGRRLADQPLDN